MKFRSIFATLLCLAAPFVLAQEKPEDLVDLDKLAPREGPREDDDTVYITTGPGGASHFDVDKRVIIFTGDVEVDHPMFHITCDELTLHLKDESAKAEAVAAAEGSAGGGAVEGAAALTADEVAAKGFEGLEEGDAEETPADSMGLSNSSIETAIATGRRVVIRKLAGKEGQAQVGQCRHATYDGKTGDMTLREWPRVQRGNHLVIGTVRSTQIILRQLGQHEVIGSSETRIIRKEAPAK